LGYFIAIGETQPMRPGLSDAVLGALSGLVATFPMTATMSRLHRRLPRSKRYPLPPRELSEHLPSLGVDTSTATLAHHFLYGAAAGALFGAFSPRRDLAFGSAYGAAIWTASYLGWVPASRGLKPATQHPAQRNGLMVAAHLVWGAALAIGLRELDRSRAESFSLSTSPAPRLKDRPRSFP
jgi:hypothetical protein